MIPAFYISGSSAPRPDSKRTIFADGSADSSFRDGVDLELSHWVPNRTPKNWKADTSTAICLRFLDEPPTETYDLAINNHADVDGILSVWILTHSESAQRHKNTLIRAAEMGDFSACAGQAAQRLFLGLTLVMLEGKEEGWNAEKIYEEAFLRIPDLLGEGDEDDEYAADPRIATGMLALDRGIEAIETAAVMVAEATPRLTLFHYPLMDGEALEAALKIPAFNAFPDDSVWLWPQARNRFDGECVQLVTIPVEGGFHHDLWYPGYMWADTPERWRAKGFEFAGSTNGYRMEFPALEEAVRQLGEAEKGEGSWVLANELSPFASIPGRGFPVVLSFVDHQGKPAKSRLGSQEVAERLAGVFPG